MSGRTWEYLGGGGAIRTATLRERDSAMVLGPAHLLQVDGSCSVRDLVWRARRQLPQPDARSYDDVWIGCTALRVATEVTRVRVSGREIAVPGHGHVVVVWKVRGAVPHLVRPQITALDGSGRVLTELGLGSYLDSATLAAIS